MVLLRRVEAWAFVVGFTCLVGLRWAAPVQADSAAGERSSAITGQVVRADGKPVDGAEVCATLGTARTSGATLASGPGLTDRATRADATGRFHLDWPEATWGQGPSALWVYHPGLGLRRVAIAPTRPASAPPLRVVLEPIPAPATALVRVVTWAGEPAPGVRVGPRLWYEGATTADSINPALVPARVTEWLSATTDARGLAHFADLSALHLAGVAVTRPDARGIQLGEWEPGWEARARGVRLRDVGQIRGQVRGDDDRPRAHWSVVVQTRVDGRIVASATATTDRAGQFALAQVAAGPLEIRAEPPFDSADEVAARTVQRPTLAPGQTLAIEVHARRGVRIAGRVVDAESGAPIAAAVVAVGDATNPDRTLTTAADGRFAATLRHPPSWIGVVGAPEPFLLPLVEGGDPARLGRAALARGDLVLKLERGLMLRGLVDLPPNSPAGATSTVQGTWDVRTASDRAFSTHRTATEVGADGRFLIGPVPPGVEVRLVAAAGDGVRGPEATLTATADGGPIRLAGPRRATDLTLVGRVVDPAGDPVADAALQFRVAPMSPSGGALVGPSGHRVTVAGLHRVVTDREGRFRHAIPGDADADADATGALRWFAAVETEVGVGPAQVGVAGQAQEIRFPDLVDPTQGHGRELVGQVQGSDGQGVVGVSVRDLAGHRTTTTAGGQFRLARPGRDPGVPPILVVEAAGYRCSGLILRDEPRQPPGPVVLTLRRLDEPALGGGDLRPARLPDAAVKPVEWASVVDRHDPIALATLVELVAESHPEQAADLLRDGSIGDPRVADGLRLRVARYLAARRGAPAAETILSTIRTPEAHARASLAVAGVALGLTKDQRTPLIERVERDARSIPDLPVQVRILGEVAAAWLDLGQIDRARAALRDAEVGADSLPRATTGAAAWSALAPILARLEPAQARNRLDALIDPRLADRGRLAAAEALGHSQPAEAARFFREVRDRRLAGSAVAAIAHGIAPHDAPLAQTLIESVRERYPVEAAHALGLLAHALAPTDRAEALALLDLAFDRLTTSAHAGRVADDPARPVEPAHVASALLAAVEAVDPDLVREFAWRAVALHDARPTSHPASPSRQRSAAVLAALLHRYEPTLALGLFDPSQLNPAAVSPADLAPLLVASARLAPHLAARWAHTIAPSAARDDHQLALLVAALAPSRAAQAALDARHLFHLWTPTRPPTAQP